MVNRKLHRLIPRSKVLPAELPAKCPTGTHRRASLAEFMPGLHSCTALPALELPAKRPPVIQRSNGHQVKSNVGLDLRITPRRGRRALANSPTMTASDRFVSVAVAGSLSGVTDRTIRRWIASGRLPVVSGPRGRLVDLEDVRRLAALSGHASALDPVNVQIVTGSPDPSRIHVRTELDPDQTDDPDDPQKGVRVTLFSAEGLGELVALVHGKDQQKSAGRCTCPASAGPEPHPRARGTQRGGGRDG